MIIAFVLSVMAACKSSGFNLNSFSLVKTMGTHTPPANATAGSYAT